MSDAARDWRTPTVMLAAGALVLAISLGIRHGFGIFMMPMSQDHGWTREVFAFAIALQNLVWGIAQPFAGRLADRVGAGKAVLGGTILYVAGLALMAIAQTGTGLALSAGVLIGLGLSGTTFNVVFAAIARATPSAKRSMALGTSMAVASLGQFAMLPGAVSLIAAYGWVIALVALAFVGALMAPLSAGLAEKPQTLAAGEIELTLKEVLAEAFAQRGFWLLAFGFFVCGFQLLFITVHLPAYLADRGLPGNTGAFVLALVGLFNIAGSYCAGVWGGRWSKPKVLAAIYIGRGLTIALFVLMPLTTTSAYLFGALMGFFWLSTVPLTNGTVATLFGVRNLSMLGGIVFFFHQVGAFLGGWLGGRIYDTLGSYGAMWWLTIGLAIVAALLNWPIREQPVARLRVS